SSSASPALPDPLRSSVRTRTSSGACVALGPGTRATSTQPPPPAPLDPSKVAATLRGGDYIEAEADGSKIGGKVSHVTERGFVAIEHLGEFAIHHITATPTPDGHRMFVLTHHQPAP